MKYFKPVTWQKENAAERELADSELNQKLINNFVRNNDEKFEEIKKALNEGDIKLAHRLVHSLKSNAGQLNKGLLRKAAEDVETCLKDGENLVSPRQMENLEMELKTVITELSALVKETDYSIADELKDVNEARETFERLETLLEAGDIDCLTFIENLKLIPGSRDLIQQIENFDFKPALMTLNELKKKIIG